jgi:hypothetical protein
VNEAAIGIVVGVAVALASQFISYVFDIFKEKRKERRQASVVLSLLYHELSFHKSRYEHLLKHADEKIAREGEEATDYSYTPIQTTAYENVYLAYWHLLPDEVVRPLLGYYEAVSHVNALSGDFATPTPVPIRETKKIVEGVYHRVNDLLHMLEKYVSVAEGVTA